MLNIVDLNEHLDLSSDEQSEIRGGNFQKIASAGGAGATKGAANGVHSGEPLYCFPPSPLPSAPKGCVWPTESQSAAVD